MKLETIIGLEFHVQLKTQSKMFCSCENQSDNITPNTHICPICLGHPGTLPTINEQAVNWAIKTSLALNCKINNYTKFDRKNYFYPDLPKGYQISQYDIPLAENGYFVINYKSSDGLSGSLTDEKQLKKIELERLHMEEDTAKNTHKKNHSLLDFNRSGAPLIEIVTRADFRSPQEAKTFAQELRLLLRYLDVSDANMEKGQLRCDANISLRPEGDDKLYSKTEVKNINSFKSLERALEFEIKRQTVLWKKGTPPKKQSTRGWNDKTQETIEQRTKESLADYRYFPEPDLPPLNLENSTIENLKKTLTESPQDKRRRFTENYGFSLINSKLLTLEKKVSFYVENVISELQEWLNSLEETEGSLEEIWEANKTKILKLFSNWFINKLLPQTDNLTNCKVTAENFAEFLTLIYKNKINKQISEKILTKMIKTGGDPSQIIDIKEFEALPEINLDKLTENIIKDFPEQIEEYKNGKEPVIKFLVGQIMKISKGQADAIEAEEMLKNKIVKS